MPVGTVISRALDGVPVAQASGSQASAPTMLSFFFFFFLSPFAFLVTQGWCARWSWVSRGPAMDMIPARAPPSHLRWTTWPPQLNTYVNPDDSEICPFSCKQSLACRNVKQVNQGKCRSRPLQPSSDREPRPDHDREPCSPVPIGNPGRIPIGNPGPAPIGNPGPVPIGNPGRIPIGSPAVEFRSRTRPGSD